MARESDFLVGFYFMLDLEGVATGYFAEIAGLGSETEVIDHGTYEITQKIPGRLKWGDLTLKRGVTASMDIWK